MAYPIALNSIIEVAFESELFGQQVLNLLHYKFTAGTTITDGAATAQQVMDVMRNIDFIYDSLKNVMSVDVRNLIMSAQWISPVRYRYVVDSGGAENGEVAVRAIAPNVAVTITKQGQEANRRNQGAMHIAGVPYTYVEDGVLTEAAKPEYLALADDLLAQITTAAGQVFVPIIFNRGTPALSPQIVQTILQNTSRVMRRRTVGLGS